MKQPMFERRHYCAVAKVMAAAVEPPYGPEEKGSEWRLIKGLLGDMFAADNPRFNKGRFDEACEP